MKERCFPMPNTSLGVSHTFHLVEEKWLRDTIIEPLQFSDSTKSRGKTWFFKLFQNHLTRCKSYEEPLTGAPQVLTVCYPLITASLWIPTGWPTRGSWLAPAGGSGDTEEFKCCLIDGAHTQQNIKLFPVMLTCLLVV